MEILICVKEVPDETVEIHLDPASMQPDLSRASAQANAFDSYALEMAARYVEANGGSITLISLGKSDTVATLRNCIAVGATKAYAVIDPALDGADSTAIAKVLKSAIAKLEEESGKKFDLILTGKESTDYVGGEFGGILAEVLALPEIGNVVSFEETSNGIKAKKELESGYAETETSLPAVFTISTPGYSPRYPTIKSKMAARKVAVPVYSLADLGLDVPASKVEFSEYIDPPKRTAGEKIIDLSPEDAVAYMMKKLTEAKAL